MPVVCSVFKGKKSVGWLLVALITSTDAFKSNQRKTAWETEDCFRTRAEEIGRLTVGFVGSEWGINHTSDAVAKILISRGRNGPHNSQTSAANSGDVPRLKELSCLRARARGERNGPDKAKHPMLSLGPCQKELSSFCLKEGLSCLRAGAEGGAKWADTAEHPLPSPEPC